jgi:glycosyltransferase involved in cell wall biosynthesis
VTCYNYQDHVASALRSIFSSQLNGLQIELIIINDASTDQSAQVIKSCLDQSPYPFYLYTPSWNIGLSRARNLALSKACGEFVFILDADNMVHPTALYRLHAKACATGSAAAYGPIQTIYHEAGPGRLISDRPFDPQALFHGNYIDAMALFRRSSILSAGGYDVNLLPIIGGWEDYALWLEFALRGYQVEFEKEVIAYYRIKPNSMVQQITPQEMAAAMSVFQTRYRALQNNRPSISSSDA